MYHIECSSVKLFQKMITEATCMGMIPLYQFRFSARENLMHNIRVQPDRVNVEDVIVRVVTYWHQTHPLHLGKSLGQALEVSHYRLGLLDTEHD